MQTDKRMLEAEEKIIKLTTNKQEALDWSKTQFNYFQKFDLVI